jgi:hypothetical protein
VIPEPLTGGSQKPLQPVKLASTATTTAHPSIDRQPRRLAGIPSSARHANSKPLPAPAHPGPLLVPGRSAAEGTLVDTVIVAVPLVAEALSVTVELLAVQVGSVVAPEGDAVSVQASVTVPA